MIDMTENDFGVILRPVLVDGKEWVGDVQVSVFSNQMPKVDDETHAQLMFLAYKMSAMVQFCQDNDEFDEALEDYTMDMVEELGLGDSDPVESKQTKIVGREGNIECIDAIESALSAEEFQGFCKGNAIKYTWRANRKQDARINLEKCRWYINKLLDNLA